MKKIKFDCHNSNFSPAYTCSEPRDNSGFYYKAEEVDLVLKEATEEQQYNYMLEAARQDKRLIRSLIYQNKKLHEEIADLKAQLAKTSRNLDGLLRISTIDQYHCDALSNQQRFDYDQLRNMLSNKARL